MLFFYLYVIILVRRNLLYPRGALAPSEFCKARYLGGGEKGDGYDIQYSKGKHLEKIFGVLV